MRCERAACVCGRARAEEGPKKEGRWVVVGARPAHARADEDEEDPSRGASWSVPYTMMLPPLDEISS